ncbi:transferase [Mycobacteroides abscessus subsp. abscessus]|nr:transferase [Mycobacteroides abscessus subsp. abscessus]
MRAIRGCAPDRAFIFTSFHQSPLPLALLCRMAGVKWIGAISEDYPGTLLDLRHRVPQGVPEPLRALSLVEAAGGALPPSDGGTPAGVRQWRQCRRSPASHRRAGR